MKFPRWFKNATVVVGAIATFLFLSTIYDFIQGDFSSSRIITLALSVSILALIFIVYGHKKVRKMLEYGIGVK